MTKVGVIACSALKYFIFDVYLDFQQRVSGSLLSAESHIPFSFLYGPPVERGSLHPIYIQQLVEQMQVLSMVQTNTLRATLLTQGRISCKTISNKTLVSAQ